MRNVLLLDWLTGEGLMEDTGLRGGKPSPVSPAQPDVASEDVLYFANSKQASVWDIEAN